MREISEEMYHRFYRLHKRNIPPEAIANTLNLPLRTVQQLINRMNMTHSKTQKKVTTVQNPVKSENADYLDIYFYTKTRYSIIQLVGVLTEKYSENLDKELQKSLTSSWKAIALEMSNVSLIDETCSNLIISYYQNFLEKDKFLAILDPSPAVDSQLIELKLEGNVPVFGTELAFEENAFRKKIKNSKRRNNQ
ncbi:MAG TPA: STAS domain-containing protein [Chitinispirillaceae bacterium]|nr:STAS domain-containing protein [Chitinispirillaceae bacterium]